ncbi:MULTISPECIES: hypothetical protein [unclassified Pseudonocardia]|jgi:hypothetical protein|uniref:hypothetical protein n=1 Tax=unclassified Pseudonocardia TaxID=2619320 RepID=UPI0001FFE757|nr:MULTISPECIES: hypothetical protein [unclassified Pseudonocardia]ALL76133.1 hypothetical protein AD006_13895 [Pseudonocardia sp. EC080610-09]ALL83157.1 hypothetical protein AD017_21720 [Pseudonocardia sp. EC080619-01]OLL86765.1 Small hypothetical protein [Pseudonocardia sp. Ae263_Ps1]OLL93191.1 Small hypothetical protein [Pseudonocardia sp. Ae356_Ps1]OLM19656.1 Small hypothetical protein [Pseudonocardia sp. Ae707_Ps1]
MVRFLVGVAVGYVLGTRAGHERYEQLVRAYHRAVDHPVVQGAAGVAQAGVEGAIGKVRGERADGDGHS